MATDIGKLSERISKLRSMREELCKKENNWKRAFDIKDWINDQLNELLRMSRDESIEKKDIENRLEDILCVLEPEDKDNE